MTRYSLAAGVVGLALTFGAPPAQAQQAHSLDAGFAKADKNKDGFLDAEELAKAFRGPNAKVIEDKAGAKESHPDHQFMDTWDANKDGKISKAEFEKYEQQQVTAARAAVNRNRNFSRVNRPNYRAPLRHRGYSGRGYGTNPYQNQARALQRAYQQQRQAYTNLRRYGVYSPNVRGGYRGVQRHHHGRR